MYSYLSGTVISMDDGRLSILVEGTGLGLEVLPTPLLFAKCSIGEVIEAHLYHHITDVSEALFAFANMEEKRMFKKLLKVDGIGGKSALSLLGLGVPSLIQAIASGDEKMISSAPGVGKKTALKVIVELKNEVSGEDIASAASDSAPARTAKRNENPTDPIAASLISMGYDRREVENALASLPSETVSTEAKTVAVLRMLAR